MTWIDALVTLAGLALDPLLLAAAALAALAGIWWLSVAAGVALALAMRALGLDQPAALLLLSAQADCLAMWWLVRAVRRRRLSRPRT